MAINAACENNPDDLRIWIQMAVICYHQGRFEAALEYWGHASKLAPETGYFHYCMGKIYEELEKYPVAERCFAKAEELGYDPSEEE